MESNHPYLSDIEWLLLEELALRQYCAECEERHEEVQAHLDALSPARLKDVA